MKILHVNWSGNLGGAENFAFQLAKSQRMAGHDVAMLYMADGAIFGERATDCGLEVFECNMKNGYDFLHLSRCFAFIKNEKFDIIHNHNGSPFLNLAKMVSPSSVLVNHIHGTKLGCVSRDRKSILLWHILSSLFVDQYIANSNYTKGAVRKFIYPRNKITVIYNGIDLECFKPDKSKRVLRRELALTASTKVIGVVARLSRSKGVDIFIEIAKRVSEDDENVKFIIVGDGELRSALEEQTAMLNMQNKIIFTGVRTDIPNILSLFDIFLSTPNRESFGITLLESMAMGVPIVAFAIGGVTEVVDKNCAILVEPGESAVMSHHVQLLLKSKAKRRALISGGYKRVGRFDISDISRRVVGLYEYLKNE